MQVTGAGDRVVAHPNQELRLSLRGLHSPEPASAELSQQVLGVRPHSHPVDVEPTADRDHAVAVLSGGSDRVHFLRRQRCSTPSRWVQHHPRLGFRRSWFLASDARFRLLPRGTQSLQSFPRVRAESTGVHRSEQQNGPANGGVFLIPRPFAARTVIPEERRLRIVVLICDAMTPTRLWEFGLVGDFVPGCA